MSPTGSFDRAGGDKTRSSRATARFGNDAGAATTLQNTAGGPAPVRRHCVIGPTPLLCDTQHDYPTWALVLCTWRRQFQQTLHQSRASKSFDWLLQLSIRGRVDSTGGERMKSHRYPLLSTLFSLTGRAEFDSPPGSGRDLPHPSPSSLPSSSSCRYGSFSLQKKYNPAHPITRMHQDPDIEKTSVFPTTVAQSHIQTSPQVGNRGRAAVASLPPFETCSGANPQQHAAAYCGA
jgi:hypothetical protein